jgi:predicted transcriptional regulator
MALKRMNNKGVWHPSETELKVAEYLASGYSQNRTAALCHLTQACISQWLQRPEFAALVDELTDRFLNSGDSVYAATVALSRLIVHQVITGERERDATTDLAFSYLRETEFPVRRGETHKQFGASDKPRLP